MLCLSFHRGQACFPQFFGSEGSRGSSNGLFTLSLLCIISSLQIPRGRRHGAGFHPKALNKVTYTQPGVHRGEKKKTKRADADPSAYMARRGGKKGGWGEEGGGGGRRNGFCLIVHLHLAALSQSPVHEISPAENQWRCEPCKGQPLSGSGLGRPVEPGLVPPGPAK